VSQFKENQIIILLGAGASVDAGIPHSNDMINKVEELICKEWKEYTDLYNFIKSSIRYSDGINGKFDGNSTNNIERFVNILDEIKKKKEHVLFPFVGAWNPTLIELAGQNFEKAGALSNLIVEKLRDSWISLNDYHNARYFKKLEILQEEYNFPLRVFSLNYDLCLEKNCAREKVERGFSETLQWDWKKYDESIPEPKEIYLYKLHGSTDWYYDENVLKCSDDPGKIKDEEAAIIFGTTYKLQYRDPFLFYAYEFRKYSLESLLIVSIGYGFGDEHINQIIKQALDQDCRRILLSVTPIDDDGGVDKQIKKIVDILKIKNPDQIKICSKKAKDFMENDMNPQFLWALFPESKEELFQIVENTLLITNK
jgi:hypothetical protein